VGENNFLSNQLFSSARYNHYAAIKWLRMQMDSINYKWQKWVIGYDEDNQNQFLSMWMGAVTLQKIVFALSISAIAAIMLAAWLLWRKDPQKKVDPEIQIYLQFCVLMAKINLHRAKGDSELVFLKKIQSRIKNQDVKNIAEDFTRLYLKLRYESSGQTGGGSIHSDLLKALQTQNKLLKRAIQRAVD
jgi:hypothetical protein